MAIGQDIVQVNGHPFGACFGILSQPHPRGNRAEWLGSSAPSARPQEPSPQSPPPTVPPVSARAAGSAAPAPNLRRAPSATFRRHSAGSPYRRRIPTTRPVARPPEAPVVPRRRSPSRGPPPETSLEPSGLNATDRTKLPCPVRRAISLPVATSHNRTVLSKDPEASIEPSGLKATESTPLLLGMVACSSARSGKPRSARLSPSGARGRREGAVRARGEVRIVASSKKKVQSVKSNRPGGKGEVRRVKFEGERAGSSRVGRAERLGLSRRGFVLVRPGRVAVRHGFYCSRHNCAGARLGFAPAGFDFGSTGPGVTARVISGVASHIQVEETEALHVSRIALMVRGY
ncbi:MAG: hypothetical protein BECKG1743D_GA0114223_108941, partial [Candidatus Kentron sp. G]